MTNYECYERKGKDRQYIMKRKRGGRELKVVKLNIWISLLRDKLHQSERSSGAGNLSNDPDWPELLVTSPVFLLRHKYFGFKFNSLGSSIMSAPSILDGHMIPYPPEAVVRHLFHLILPPQTWRCQSPGSAI